jgi:outer membrane lipoprotein-sorting protein
MTAALIIALCAIVTAPDAPDTLLQDVAAKREPVATLVAHFEQQTIMPDDILSASGTIAYCRPRMLAVRFSDPELVYLIDQDQVREYDAELGQVQLGSLADTPEIEVLFAGFGQNIERLEEAYDVFPFDPGDAPEGAQGLELHPKDREDEDSLFEMARLYLRPNDMLPYRIEIVNGPDARVIYELSNIEPGKVDPALFSVDLPAGTRIIANEELMETVGEGGQRLSLAPPEEGEAGAEE